MMGRVVKMAKTLWRNRIPDNSTHLKSSRRQALRVQIVCDGHHVAA